MAGHDFDVSDLTRTVKVRGVEIRVSPCPYALLARSLSLREGDESAARDLTVEAIEQCCSYADDGSPVRCADLPWKVVEELAAAVTDMTETRENFSAPPSSASGARG